MKIKCDFCKTEYSTDCAASSLVKCAVCGNVWNVAIPARKNAWLVFFASVCALLAAIVFAVVVVAHHKGNNTGDQPLVANIDVFDTIVDANGVSHFVVKGRVTNVSDDIYGVPDLIIVSRGSDDSVIARQKFMPSATLLDAGASVEFSHTLSAPIVGVKKITVELGGMQSTGGTE